MYAFPFFNQEMAIAIFVNIRQNNLIYRKFKYDKA